MLNHYWIRFLALLNHAKRYVVSFVKWSFYAGITGLIGGFLGMFFHASVEWATNERINHPKSIFLLPLVGLIIVGLYDALNSYEDNTDTVVSSARHSGRRVPLVLAPLIFISTVLTHLCGGSAGREGAALQLGGVIGTQLSDFFDAGRKETGTFIMCGMSALFSALFGTPLTAIFFALEVSHVGIMPYSALIPCMVSSITAYAITRYNHIEPTRFMLSNLPEVTVKNIVITVILAAMAAVVSIIFCVLLHRSEKLMRRIKNEYLRIFIGGIAIVALTLLFNTRDYNGAGMDIIVNAVEGGHSSTFAFLLKMIFTAITIAAGYKGGEIVPTLFVGATFGCVAGGIMGMDPGLGAAIGMIGMFCGMLNCPIASIFLSIELFGADGLMLFVIAAIVSYMLSGYYGLYHSQKILSSKLGVGRVEKHTIK